ncbi:hypothetical protein HT031_000863 [Scenedesmus sp. PABB004]|nr:hypothetical protein HT031_000863 [Scenedesmus sp. PABB004]
MDFYDGERGGGLALAAPPMPLPVVGSPGYARGSFFLPRLTSIPEAASEHEQELRRAAAAAAAAAARAQEEQDAARGLAACGSSGSMHCAVLELLDSALALSATTAAPPPVLAGEAEPPPQAQPQRASSSGSRRAGSSRHAPRSSSDASSSGASSGDGGGDGDDDASVAAASAWAVHIRHFTDCVPLSAVAAAADSVCSAGTQPRSLGGGAAPAEPAAAQPWGEAEAEARARHRRRRAARRQAEAAGAGAASPPASSSCASLGAGGSLDAEGSQAALQASLLAALEELQDDLDWCPWDRVAAWLEAHQAAAAGAAAAGVGGAGPDQPQQQHSRGAARQAPPGSQADGGEGEQEVEAPAFDAPDWWQEAVLARLQQQRADWESLSWWGRARVLASLAAGKAASLAARQAAAALQV